MTTTWATLRTKAAGMGMLDFDSWLRAGIEQGWIGPPVCATHDGVPSTEAEDNEVMDGHDPCLHIVRLYENPAVKAAVEDNHPPSVWRWTNMRREP